MGMNFLLDNMSAVKITFIVGSVISVCMVRLEINN